MSKLTVKEAKDIYNIEQWSAGYFDISEQGEVIALPQGNINKTIVLSELVQQLKQQGIALPVLVRFTDILQDRVDTLITAFAQAMQEQHYQAEYTPVYPIKVNQQYSVVKKLLQHPSQRVGLEAGSKPELLAILGMAEKPITIICNGYKDEEFLRIATIGSALGHKVTIVIEKLSELNNLIRVMQEMKQTPIIGVRIRLISTGKGKWQNTGGEKGKFGLSISQVLQVIDLLRHHEYLEQLQLVHFHIGSQIANIFDIQEAVTECARHYAELYQLGVPISTVDVGGGLGIDYEGSESRSDCSINYSINEYARNVIQPIASVCQQLNLPCPNIITESGRAITAHHAVLITNIIDYESVHTTEIAHNRVPSDFLQKMQQRDQQISPRTASEVYHDVVHYFADAHQQYVHGVINLKQWASIEQLYFSILQKIQAVLSVNARSHREILDELNEKLADKVFTNFSIFQSLPDAWAINQLFPIIPLQYLDTPLNNRVTIQDMTCDSDGQIKQYSDRFGVETSLPLPAYIDKKEFYLGIFLVGAYQETLGDLHNLFGDPNSIHVEMSTEQQYHITNTIAGDSVADVLHYVNFDFDILISNLEQWVQRSEQLTPEIQVTYLKELREGMRGYTYFES